jgi:nicotinamide mononucleotide transporter
MNDFIQFFLDPYQEATFLNKSLELIAAIFGIASVFFAKKENIWVFPTGIVSTALYVFLLTQ